MTDLTRLMFDDGATRKPLAPTSLDFTFRFAGKTWRIIELTDEECRNNETCDFSFYKSGHCVEEPLNIDNFKERLATDPDGAVHRMGYNTNRIGWPHRSSYHPTLHNVLFVRFEVV